MLLKLNYKDDEELQKFNKDYLVFRNQLKNENEDYYENHFNRKSI
jgi:ribosomal protein S24E